MKNYEYTKEVAISFREAVAKTKEELQKEGFGVLTEIDVKETMKKKLDIDYENSLYIGDALGRKNDWSDCDLKFAQNCGLKHMSPEDFFGNTTPNSKVEDKYGDIKYGDINFVDNNVKIYNVITEKENDTKEEYKGNQELIIMVGYPASGKSTYVKRYKGILHDDPSLGEKYSILSGDILKTEAKIIKNMKSSLINGQSVIIDATNPSNKKRNTFIECARNIVPNIPIKIIHLTTEFNECMERNLKRDVVVPKIAFHMYEKKLEYMHIGDNI